MSRMSVLLPVHNGAPYLAEALESLALQDSDAFDVILVDDGSTDGSADLAQKFWPRDDVPLRIIRQPKRGIVAALNRGLASCTAPWVVRMDADDICLPKRLSTLQSYLDTHPDIDVLGSRVEIFCDDDAPPGAGYMLYQTWLNQLLTHEAMMRERFVESPVAHPSVAFRRETVVRAGGYAETPWAEDYDLWLRLAESSCRFAKVPEELLRWRDYGSRTSRRDPRCARSSLLRCKAHYLAKSPCKGRQVIICGAGPIGKRLGRYLRDAGAALKNYIDIDPKKIGRLVNGVLVEPDTALQGPQAHDILLVAVGSRGARDLIRQALNARSWREGEHYFCAA